MVLQPVAGRDRESGARIMVCHPADAGARHGDGELQPAEFHLSTNGNGEERACPIRAVKDAVDATIGNAVCVFDSCKIFHIFEFAFASSVLHACCVIKHGANIRHFCID